MLIAISQSRGGLAAIQPADAKETCKLWEPVIYHCSTAADNTSSQCGSV